MNARLTRFWALWLVIPLTLGLSVDSSRAQSDSPLTVGISVDVDPASTRLLLDSLREEIEALTQQEFTVRFPEEKILGAGGTLAGARVANDALLADDEVDMVIALGPLVSAEIVQRRRFAKPVLAPMVIDHYVSDLPRGEGAGSGLENLAYIEPVFDFVDDMEVYRQLVDFRNLALIAPPGLTAIIRERAQGEIRFPELDLRVLPFAREGDPTALVEALLDDVDAVYLVGPTQDQTEEFAPLLKALTDRGLPTFSTSGEVGVRAGALAGLTPENWERRLVRRAALHARRILLGEPASELPVQLTRQQNFYINMGTAVALGISPTFALMSDAELIGDLQREPSRELGLLEVMREARAKNRDLEAARRELDAAREDVGVARSVLLPQLSALVGGRLIDGDRAEQGTFGAEQTWTAGAELTQLLWSERAWSSVAVRKLLVETVDAALLEAELDVSLEAAAAYFDVLSALAIERIRRENLRFTRNNLERARVRLRLGAASPAEEYRWESQVARDQDALVTSIAQRNLAEIELNRVLHLPLESKLGVAEPTTTEAVFVHLDARFLPYVDDPASLRQLRAFVAREAVANSPEIAQLDAAIEIERRRLASENRSFFSPEIALTGDYTRTLDRGGTGSELFDDLSYDDDDWTFTLGMSLPIFEGAARFARRSQSAATILQLERQRESVAERIEQRARSAIHLASASFTRIRLTQRASEAARQNFELVADAYGEGAVSIIDLLDAQTAYFTAQQEAASALYQFMSDVMEVERAAGSFIVLYTDEEKDDVFERLEAFATSNGSAPGGQED